MSYNYYFARDLIDAYGITRREAVKIIAQVEADRKRREMFSPEFARVKALHDGVYRLLCDARQANDHAAEIMLVTPCNEFYRRMYHVTIGDLRAECHERAKNLVIRRKCEV